jgi:toxin-antitoxin system PIN domain toxin
LIAVDTNILIYAHREESPHHEAAARCLGELTEMGDAWAIPWSCLHEFLGIVTRARFYDPPTPLTDAIDQVDAWLECPTLILLPESDQHWSELRNLVVAGWITGARIHDARIAAICLQHGVREFWSADRDFSRFPSLRTRNPLIA